MVGEAGKVMRSWGVIWGEVEGNLRSRSDFARGALIGRSRCVLGWTSGARRLHLARSFAGQRVLNWCALVASCSSVARTSRGQDERVISDLRISNFKGEDAERFEIRNLRFQITDYEFQRTGRRKRESA